jgi:hypothetical protein
MTDRDKASKGFLERWSRKKIDAEQNAPGPVEPNDAAPPGPRARPAENAAAPAAAAPKAEFDLASLPSLESIAAGTDIRAFLAPGVPKELARAALRRAWTADPAIRDFIGLAENAWDFTDPAAMPGFGPLPPGTDIKKLVAQIFGDDPKPSEPCATVDPPADAQAPDIKKDIASSSSPGTEVASATDTDEPPRETISAYESNPVQADLVQRNNNIASQNNISREEAEERKKRRMHGGALPQ